jgi:hypothetical protein
MNLSGVREGGTVFVIDTANGARRGDKGSTRTVTKVTKQTVYAQHRLAFDIATGQQKQDAYCHLRAWPSEEDYRNEHALDDAWQQLRRELTSWAPRHLTLADIQAISEKLKEPKHGPEQE